MKDYADETKAKLLAGTLISAGSLIFNSKTEIPYINFANSAKIIDALCSVPGSSVAAFSALCSKNKFREAYNNYIYELKKQEIIKEDEWRKTKKIISCLDDINNNQLFEKTAKKGFWDKILRKQNTKKALREDIKNILNLFKPAYFEYKNEDGEIETLKGIFVNGPKMYEAVMTLDYFFPNPAAAERYKLIAQICRLDKEIKVLDTGNLAEIVTEMCLECVPSPAGIPKLNKNILEQDSREIRGIEYWLRAMELKRCNPGLSDKRLKKIIEIEERGRERQAQGLDYFAGENKEVVEEAQNVHKAIRVNAFANIDSLTQGYQRFQGLDCEKMQEDFERELTGTGESVDEYLTRCRLNREKRIEIVKGATNEIKKLRETFVA